MPASGGPHGSLPAEALRQKQRKNQNGGSSAKNNDLRSAGTAGNLDKNDRPHANNYVGPKWPNFA
ncbi:MAG: hypothetical protein DME69_05970 [Verrucomicrobia bacterium]|nr:MAG: hypothetical protein AUH91_02265 [Verrucomicrobia bacterium 13_1_40CM_4_54_4]PYJ50438.1 MAG: hypothetical protein DME87_06340 [Verrucomicrobiota bacterium]PYJ79134.1 MAG: hypothetical protein DME69_05970 [Verrucomicrobiota bacterium]